MGCPEADDVPNTEKRYGILYEGNLTYIRAGSTVEYQCFDPYIGSFTHTCMANGVWAGEDVNCQGKYQTNQSRVQL